MTMNHITQDTPRADMEDLYLVARIHADLIEQQHLGVMMPPAVCAERIKDAEEFMRRQGLVHGGFMPKK